RTSGNGSPARRFPDCSRHCNQPPSGRNLHIRVRPHTARNLASVPRGGSHSGKKVPSFLETLEMQAPVIRSAERAVERTMKSCLRRRPRRRHRQRNTCSEKQASRKRETALLRLAKCLAGRKSSPPPAHRLCTAGG